MFIHSTITAHYYNNTYNVNDFFEWLKRGKPQIGSLPHPIEQNSVRRGTQDAVGFQSGKLLQPSQ